MNNDVIVARVVRDVRNERINDYCGLCTSIMCHLDQLRVLFNMDDSIYDLFDTILHEFKRRQLHRTILAAKRLGLDACYANGVAELAEVYGERPGGDDA